MYIPALINLPSHILSDNTAVTHLFVHLNVEPVRHLVVLQRQQRGDAIKQAGFRDLGHSPIHATLHTSAE